MNPYFYRITVDKVLDGDTLSAFFDLGFNIKMKVHVRLMGYDAPETFRPKSANEKAAGLRVKDEFTRLLNLYAGVLYCESTNIDLYGRSSGVIYFYDHGYVSINDMVLKFMTDNHLTKAEIK